MDYKRDFNALVDQTRLDVKATRKEDLWLIPSSSTGQYHLNPWSPSAILATGIVDQYIRELHAISIVR